MNCAQYTRGHDQDDRILVWRLSAPISLQFLFSYGNKFNTSGSSKSEFTNTIGT